MSLHHDIQQSVAIARAVVAHVRAAPLDPDSPARLAETIVTAAELRVRVDVVAADNLARARARRSSLTSTSTAWAHRKADEADAIAATFASLALDALAAETALQALAEDLQALRNAT